MKYSAGLLVTIVLLLNSLACHALKWSDCGTPLTRWVSYESITLSPSEGIVVGTKLSLNVFAIVSQPLLPLDTINTRVTVVKDGQLYLDASTRSLCELLQANQQNCIYREGDKISFTYEWDVPYLPRGNYSIRLHSTSTLLSKEVGCAELETSVEGLKTEGGSCTYTSSFTAAFDGALNFGSSSHTSQQLNDYIQVGPFGNNAGDGRYALPWGTFSSIGGSKDIVGGVSPLKDVSNYVWGINGTMTNQTTVGGQTQHEYSGTLVVGYRLVDGDNSSTGPVQFIYGGNFLFYFDASSTGSYGLTTGGIVLTDKHFHPNLFPYPFVVGNLNPLVLTFTRDSRSRLTTSLSASKQWCTCGDICGLANFARLQSNSATNGGGLTLLENGAIAVGVVGLVVVVMATIFFVVHYRSSKRPLLDPAEIVYPNKPDYGSMALGEIIDEEQPADEYHH